MSASSDVDDRIDYLLASGGFLESLSIVHATLSAEQHGEFANNLKETAKVVRALFLENDLICSVGLLGQEFWNSVEGKRIGFVDGGVARLDIPSSAPIGIRVGTYSVKLGDESDERELFDFRTSVVDDLYSAESKTYVTSFEDIGKLADAARIVSELSAAVQLSKDGQKPDLVMLHGPLINPVAPYGPPGFPSFTKKMAQALVPFSTKDYEDPKDRHFVSICLELLQSLEQDDPVCVGVIERSATRTPQVARYHLQELNKRGLLKKGDLNKILGRFDAYALTDSILFSVLLNENEWVLPANINPQEPESKWPDKWKSEIRAYPIAKTTYVKTANVADPFRVQISEDQPFDDWVGNLLVNTSHLLPTYHFPVGLDIVDKYAKVPSWMSRSIRGQHATTLLMKALETGDPETISFAKRIMASKGRDWMFRPGA